MTGKSIVPSVKRRRDWLRYADGWYAPMGEQHALPDWMMTGLVPSQEPEVVRRQREIARAMEAEAAALYRIEQKYPKRLEDKR